MHPRRLAVVGAFLLAALTVSGLCSAAPAEDGPFGPIHVATNRSRYSGGGCPIEVVFTATISFVMPHPQGFVFNYHWERSDGAKSPVQVVRPLASRRSMVVHEAWRLGAAGSQYSISETLFVNSGNAHLSQSSPTVMISCRS